MFFIVVVYIILVTHDFGYLILVLFKTYRNLYSLQVKL